MQPLFILSLNFPASGSDCGHKSLRREYLSKSNRKGAR